MKKFEQLKFMVDLNWHIRFGRLNYMFAKTDFVCSFSEFIHTDTGKKWVDSEEGKKYLEWQSS